MGTIDAISHSRNEVAMPSRAKPVSLPVILGMIIAQMSHRSEKRRSRSILRDLTDGQLHDIGLTRSDVRRELAKSFFWN